MNELESVLTNRLEAIQKIKTVFQELKPSSKHFLRGPFQEKLLTKATLQRTGLNRRLINEVLSELGYVKVTIHGRLFYKDLHGHQL